MAPKLSLATLQRGYILSIMRYDRCNLLPDLEHPKMHEYAAIFLSPRVTCDADPYDTVYYHPSL